MCWLRKFQAKKMSTGTKLKVHLLCLLGFQMPKTTHMLTMSHVALERDDPQLKFQIDQLLHECEIQQKIINNNTSNHVLQHSKVPTMFHFCTWKEAKMTAQRNG